MKNLYTPSQLLDKKTFNKLEKAFEKAWSKETTFLDVRDNWSDKNKAYGQCAPTALIVYDFFGGRIIYDKTNFHIWNELPDGTQQDFSRIQFLDEKVFTIYKYKTRDDILYDETGQRTQILPRYQLLKKRFEEALERLAK